MPNGQKRTRYGSGIYSPARRSWNWIPKRWKLSGQVRWSIRKNRLQIWSWHPSYPLHNPYKKISRNTYVPKIPTITQTVKWTRKTFLPPYSCYTEWINRYPKWKCWDLSRSHRESVPKPESRPASRSTICYNRFLCPVHAIKGKMRNAGGLRNIIIITRNHSSRIFFYTFVTLLIMVKSNL